MSLFDEQTQRFDEFYASTSSDSMSGTPIMTALARLFDTYPDLTFENVLVILRSASALPSSDSVVAFYNQHIRPEMVVNSGVYYTKKLPDFLSFLRDHIGYPKVDEHFMKALLLDKPVAAAYFLGIKYIHTLRTTGTPLLSALFGYLYNHERNKQPNNITFNLTACFGVESKEFELWHQTWLAPEVSLYNFRDKRLDKRTNAILKDYIRSLGYVIN